MIGVSTLGRLKDGRLRTARGLRHAAVAAALCLLCACAAPPPISTPAPATADRRNGDGLGGTGAPSRAPQDTLTTDGRKNGDGLGGTGILGTISGFGSIIVNGAAWDFDRRTAVASDGKPSSLAALKVGQVVAGVARPQGGRYVLDTLEIQHAAIGPIDAVDHDAETMTLLGQRVRLNLAGDKTAADAFRTLRPGDVVSVSGLRLDDGTVVASRIDEQPKDDGRILVRGPAADVGAGSLRIGGLTVATLAGTVVTPPADGAHTVVAGRMINGQFTADVITGARTFGGAVTDVSLEGYAGAGPLAIQGMTVTGAALPPGTVPGDRLVVTGRIAEDGAVTAAAITKVRTVVTINAARGTLRPAAARPDVRQRPDRVAPPDRPPIDRPQALEVPRPVTPERPQIERPQGGPTS